MQQTQAVAQPQMSGEIYQQANMYQLGNLLATYTPLFASPLAIIAMMVGVIIADIILIAVVYALGYILYISIIIPILAIIYGINAMRNCNLKVYQFSFGVVRANGTQLDIIRWDQVEAIWQKVVRSRYSTRYTYTLRRSDGAMFKFDSTLRNVARLGQSMQQVITSIHLPMANAVYNAGNMVQFGVLSLSVQGISNGKEVLPWNELQSVEMKNGYLNIKRAGKTFNWARIVVAKVPNVTVFLGLVNNVRGNVVR